MTNIFIEDYIKFLQMISNVQVFPQKDILELKENNKSVLHLSMTDYFSGIREVVPNSIETISYFMIFDIYLETLNEKFSKGKSFKERYLALQKNTVLEKVIANIYRIFKICRNAVVHNTKAIKETANIIKIDYKFINKNILLTITKNGYEYLKKIVLCFLLYNESEYSYSYKELLFNSFYNKIINEIKLFNDGDGRILKISKETIDIFYRYECSNINYILVDNNIIFDLPIKYNNKSIDIIFILNGKRYIIPSEILNGTNRINIFDINKWEVEI